MDMIQDRAGPSDTAPLQLMLLPGAYMRAEDFLIHGFVGAVRRTGRPIDIMALDTGMEAYLDGSIVEQLHEEAVVPRLADGACRIWLAGLSLGGLGGLLYAQAHADLVEGLLLISPFIGTRGMVAEVSRVGGFQDWQPPTGEAANSEHRLLRWLKTYRSDDAVRPDIYLGYGRDDRFAASYRLLAGILPVDQVVTADGGHDWKTWEALWEQLLRKAPIFANAPARQR